MRLPAARLAQFIKRRTSSEKIGGSITPPRSIFRAVLEGVVAGHRFDSLFAFVTLPLPVLRMSRSFRSVTLPHYFEAKEHANE